MRRLFFALWPDHAVRAQLARAAAGIDCGDGRPVAVEKLHLTLLFIGGVDDGATARLCAALNTMSGRGFEFRLDASGWWRRSAVVWLAPTVIPPLLLGLVEQLRARAAAVDIPLQAGPYRPHVTVCRGARKRPAVGDIDCRWPVDEFSLVESIPVAGGVRYAVLRRWPLGPRGCGEGG